MNQSRSVTRAASAGYVAFAVTTIGLGILGLVTGKFTPLWAGVPQSLPARTALAYICALVSLGSGMALLWRPTALRASQVLLGFYALFMLLVRIPQLFQRPTTGPWWAAGETAVMLAAALVLYVWLGGGDPDGRRFRVATICYGLGLIPFGIAHFTYFDRTASMVPSWLPWHPAWAAFTGAGFIVAGVAMVVGLYGRLAATLSAWEIGLFTLFVWGPVVIKGPPYTPSDWSEIVVSWVLTAAAWVVASAYRGAPWLVESRNIVHDSAAAAPSITG